MTPAEIALTLENDKDAKEGGRSEKGFALCSASDLFSAPPPQPAEMDLIYVEFVKEQERGGRVDLESFCARFPGCRSAIQYVVQLHQFVKKNPKYVEAWPQAGDKHGDLTLLRELGRGAFSRVFLALEASAGNRLIVVKFARGAYSDARTQGPLSHPHIVPILSASEDVDLAISLVRMPYLGSATLANVLDRAWPAFPLAPREPRDTKAERVRKARVIPEVLRACAQPEDPPAGPVDPRLRAGSYTDGVIHLAVQLAETLAFLHAQGVCHYDLKPSNVLLDPSGKPLLLDFNLSTDARETTEPTGGTLRYMAPEQLHAFLTKNWTEVDERAELFSLAVMIYDLLTGDHPYGPISPLLNDQQLAHFLLERMNGPFRPLREVCPDVASPVACILDRCLALNPADRPQSAAELTVGLKRQFAPARRTRRWIADHSRTVLCALCLFLFCTAAAVVAWSITPPYSERQYQLGLTAYQAGEYERAERCFDLAFQSNPKNPRYRFARGVARLKQSTYLTDGSEKLDQAWNDIKQIADGKLDDRTLAFRAYMANREQKTEDAIGMYTKLLEGPYRRAMALNNRAYSYRLRNNPAGFDLALQDLNEAARLDPDSQAIRCNRAKIALFRRIKKPTLTISPQTLDDIEQAIQLGPVSREFYADAAQLYAFAAREDLHRCAFAHSAPPSFLNTPLLLALHGRGQQRIDRCLYYGGQAIANGVSLEISSHPIFQFLHPHFAFPDDAPAQPTVPSIALCLIDPVELPD